jgi:hypothetical protein
VSTKCAKRVTPSPCDANHGAGHANHTRGNGTEFAQDPLSLPSGPISRLRAKHFKESLNGLIQEYGGDSKKTKKGSNNDQGLVHVILMRLVSMLFQHGLPIIGCEFVEFLGY